MVPKMSICHSCFYVDFTIKAKNTSCNYIERADFKFNAEPLCNEYLHISLLNGPWHEFIYFFDNITVRTNVLLRPNDRIWKLSLQFIHVCKLYV